MAITYQSVDLRGVAASPVLEELLFENNTIAKSLVMFEDDIKAETIFTEASAEAVMQAYTSGAPTSSGSLNAFDAVVTPTKVMYYQEFDPNTIRFTRFKRDMAAGAWNVFSGEFERSVIAHYAKKISLDLESKFWNNALAATKAAVAALTPGAGNASVGVEEQALVAATTAGEFDGVITKAIYNSSNAAATAGVGGRIKVAGLTVTASTIKAEYDKIYAAIPAVNLSGNTEQPIIYAPRSHKQFIIIANNVVTDFNRPFNVSENGEDIFFNGLKIEFVPLPENVVFVAKKEHVVWCTDLTSDIQKVEMDKIANNREDMFLKSIMTAAAHVRNQEFNVLYVG